MGHLEEIDEATTARDTGDAEKIKTGDSDNGHVAQGAIIPEADPEKAKAVERQCDSQAEAPDEETEETDIGHKPTRRFGPFEAVRLSAAIAVAKRYRAVALGTAVALLLISVSFQMMWLHVTGDDECAPVPVHMYLTSVSRELTDIFTFQRFLIFLSDADKAYLSVGISVKTSNDMVYYEIKNKKTLYRSVIHEILVKSSEEKRLAFDDTVRIKRDILNALNTKLSGGKVEEVVITDLIHV